VKLRLFLVIVTGLLPVVTGQENRPEIKHLFVPSPERNMGASVAAANIERGADYPSVVRLRGSVEIKVPVCVRIGGDQNPLQCRGEFIVRADSAEMHEDTGAIEAHGNVRIVPTKF